MGEGWYDPNRDCQVYCRVQSKNSEPKINTLILNSAAAAAAVAFRKKIYESKEFFCLSTLILNFFLFLKMQFLL